MSGAYYNEIDPKAAATLRELIRRGLIADGDVDERSIEDVRPVELSRYTQRHFFAGFGVWSHALRCAGWPDDRPVLTGSCPCQPFSSAGSGKAFADERHLWPSLWWHIRFGEPVPVFGEQVASSDGLAWLDVVSAGLEGSGYTVGAADTCAAGFGAPHIRQRLYWLANPKAALRRRAAGEGNGRRRSAEAGGSGDARWLESSNQSGGNGGTRGGEQPLRDERDRDGRVAEPDGEQELTSDAAGLHAESRSCGTADRMGEPIREGLQGHARDGGDGNESGRLKSDAHGSASKAGAHGRVEHAEGDGRRERRTEPGERGSGCGRSEVYRPGAANGFWRDTDWLLCRDGRWRPVEAGTFPLAHGVAERMGVLRGFGNAIVAPQATEFIKAAMKELT